MDISLLFQRFTESKEIEAAIADLHDPKLLSSLIDLELQDPQRANVFGINHDNAESVILRRLELLKTVCSDFVQCCYTLNLLPLPLPSLWRAWLPLALQIADWRSQQNCPLIVGFLGGQGTGKTTLTQVLTLVLSHLNYQAISMSLDDLYLPYCDRLTIQQDDPRLARRGPPGTHDVQLGQQVLQQFRRQQFPVAIPQFDKSAWNGSGDRTDPILVPQADIVLFEGWFVGAQPIPKMLFETAPAPIVTEYDRQFARDMNERLRDYLPLWQLLDRLIVLYVSDYELSKRWRKQAEHKMIAKGNAGMIDSVIDDFVEYFCKALHPALFIHPLIRDANRANIVLEIDRNHQPGAIYAPPKTE
ncbi:glycerate kinase [Myxacorys almedinensis]|uniref:glycerate kinase n=1 Tax=Myxacorys almedinensis TaxID=2651157 RepID=UPI00192E7724|nr:glycerate kinase [Myxacorys almedinensis]